MSGPDAAGARAEAHWRDEPAPGDVEAVRDLVARARRLLRRRGGDRRRAGGRAAAERPGERLPLRFAEHADGLAGYTCFGPIPATLASFDLYWIAVHPDLHGRGLGARLLAESERRIAWQGGGRIYVDTSSRREYAPAHAFYIASRLPRGWRGCWTSMRRATPS